ncbi:P-type conjugative transfer protein TrbG [Undibacterium arcticum]|uniref:P-type conjugative transfer protein TrbG n=1 Tax=Undibacterium arcticum TaxID=1762892 RepID=A0ABV7FBD6_9BURK
MNKNLGALFAALLVSVPALAGSTKYLTAQDAAVAQARKWQQTGVAKPIMSDDGKILFPYGQYLPTITCAPLRACDIELEAGEIVTGKPLAGDAVRWKVTHAESGRGDKKVTHVVIKPTDAHLDTNLIITTDRRTYHLRMLSTANETDYLNRVGFYYPEDIADEWDTSAKVAEKEAKEKERLVVSDLPASSIDKLDFEYSFEADKSAIKPVRAFNDGTRVFIQMPEEMRSAEAPILLLYDNAGNPSVVNYRVKDLYYIVDKLFDKAVLIAGADKSQTKVVISRGSDKKKGWFW